MKNPFGEKKSESVNQPSKDLLIIFAVMLGSATLGLIVALSKDWFTSYSTWEACKRTGIAYYLIQTFGISIGSQIKLYKIDPVSWRKGMFEFMNRTHLKMTVKYWSQMKTWVIAAVLLILLPLTIYLTGDLIDLANNPPPRKACPHSGK